MAIVTAKRKFVERRERQGIEIQVSSFTNILVRPAFCTKSVFLQLFSIYSFALLF